MYKVARDMESKVVYQDQCLKCYLLHNVPQCNAEFCLVDEDFVLDIFYCFHLLLDD